MAKINNKVLEKLIETNMSETETLKIGKVDGENITIKVKKNISMEDFFGICATMNQLPFIPTDDGYNRYIPSGEVFGLHIAIIKVFTDFEIPEDTIEAYKVVAGLNLYQKVYNVLKTSDMFNDLLEIAGKYSEYHRLMNSGLGAMANADIGKAMENILPGLNEFMQGKGRE
jgi:hypothetical protein